MEKNNDKKKKIEEVKEECHCMEGEECTCGDECNCGEECHCGEECNCGEESNCDDECCCNNQEDLVKELQDALLRSQAELLNYRKRKDEEVSRIIKYAEEDVLKGFLPILDNFERAIKMDDDNLDDEVSKFLEGFKLMHKQIQELLNKFEVKEMECLDKEFDPTYHQAVVMDKVEGKDSGIITEVLQKGYMYKDRVLRTAMVKVNE